MFAPMLQGSYYMSESFKSMRHVLYPSTDPKTYGQYLQKKNHGKNYNNRKGRRK